MEFKIINHDFTEELVIEGRNGEDIILDLMTEGKDYKIVQDGAESFYLIDYDTYEKWEELAIDNQNLMELLSYIENTEDFWKETERLNGDFKTRSEEYLELAEVELDKQYLRLMSIEDFNQWLRDKDYADRIIRPTYELDEEFIEKYFALNKKGEINLLSDKDIEQCERTTT